MTTRTVLFDKNNVILSKPSDQQLRVNTGVLVLRSDEYPAFALTFEGPANFEALLPNQIKVFKEMRDRHKVALEKIENQRKMNIAN